MIRYIENEMTARVQTFIEYAAANECGEYDYRIRENLKLSRRNGEFFIDCHDFRITFNDARGGYNLIAGTIIADLECGMSFASARVEAIDVIQRILNEEMEIF